LPFSFERALARRKVSCPPAGTLAGVHLDALNNRMYLAEDGTEDGILRQQPYMIPLVFLA
jgi:hypothetical protein